MRRIAAITLAGLLTLPTVAVADDVYVDGYFRDDGTDVEPHIRSSPDGSISNNYGPSENDFQRLNPSARDADDDGLSNSMDLNSDNDLYGDEIDPNPYSADDGLGY